MMSMQQRLELERRNKVPADIKELNLDNCKASALEGLTADYVNLESLSLNNVGLQSLAGFPALPNLRRLELSDNRLQDGLQHLAGCPALTELILSGNRFRDLDALKPLASLGKLRTLDLYGCAVNNAEGYRDAVFALLPQVEFLDGLDAEDQECEENDDDEDDGEGEVNVNGDDDGGEEYDDEEDDDEEEEEEEEVGLSYLQRGDVDDEEDEDDDFNPEAVGGEDDDDDIDDEDEEDESVNASTTSAAKAKGGKVGAADAATAGDADEASSSRRGTKRKHEAESGEADN